MPSLQLPNYLRSNRKRLALSQIEVAFLLGQQKSAQVSRYECSLHLPSLETALTYEAIYKMPVSEIFAGLYANAEREVAARAKMLTSKANNKMRNREVAKRKMLSRLVAMEG